MTATEIDSFNAKFIIIVSSVMIIFISWKLSLIFFASILIFSFINLCLKGKYENLDILLETNMQVSMPSTASNYFHLLRL